MTKHKTDDEIIEATDINRIVDRIYTALAGEKNPGPIIVALISVAVGMSDDTSCCKGHSRQFIADILEQFDGAVAHVTREELRRSARLN